MMIQVTNFLSCVTALKIFIQITNRMKKFQKEIGIFMPDQEILFSRLYIGLHKITLQSSKRLTYNFSKSAQGSAVKLMYHFAGKSQKVYISAVYTGIKKPESFLYLGFSLKVARQLPLNTPKNPNRKTHLRSDDFLKLHQNFTGFLPM